MPEKHKLSIRPGGDFLAKYILRAFPDSDLTAPEEADTEIEIRSPHELIILQNGKKAVLCYPYVIGTGMTGAMMKMAQNVARGLYVRPHKRPTVNGHRTISGLVTRRKNEVGEDNSQIISVVHAIDVAKAAQRLAGQEGEFWIDDNSSTTVDDLAGAFTIRLKDKRIPVWPGWVVSILRRIFRVPFEEFTPRGERVTEIEPMNVVDYLSTHQYTEEDV